MTGTQLPIVFDAPARGKAPRHWLDLTVDERVDATHRLGLPKFRANQISRHLFDRLEDDVAGFSDIPASIREDLGAQLFPRLLEQVTQRTADQGATVKTLWRLHDGSLLESVLMRYPGRSTLCISSQAGCGMACPFCATGQGGLQRNLSQAEITVQALAANQMLASGAVPGATGRLNNIVFMGMGEPLANYDNLAAAIGILNAPWGFEIGARHITVSTSGLAPQIRQLAEHPVPVRLAISLHGATDEVRGQIMPVNKKYPLAELFDACAYFTSRRKQKLGFEYILIAGVNDSLEQARLLAAHARRLDAKVNLIPYNTVEGLAWERPPVVRQQEFVRAVRAGGVVATIRREKGHDIDAACGQLRLRVEDELAEASH